MKGGKKVVGTARKVGQYRWSKKPRTIVLRRVNAQRKINVQNLEGQFHLTRSFVGGKRRGGKQRFALAEEERKASIWGAGAIPALAKEVTEEMKIRKA